MINVVNHTQLWLSRHVKNRKNNSGRLILVDTENIFYSVPMRERGILTIVKSRKSQYYKWYLYGNNLHEITDKR